ncbi:MAG: hypothetical protein ACUVXI_04195 [bacterium]
MEYPRKFKRIVLETTLKPFRELTEEAIRGVCAELFRQWNPLVRYADCSAVLLWVADGSEILTYRGRLDEEFEWCKYIGFSNTQYPHAYEGPGARDHRRAQLYAKNPPRMTYGWLKTIVSLLKEVGSEVTEKPVSVGATFDPGPEFAHSPFKYELHREIFQRGLEGRELGLQAVPTICAYSELSADPEPYAGFPDGIPQGTPFGQFLGRQAQRFLADLGFDYIWFSNGFGFSHFAWSSLGESFDGRKFFPERARELAEKTIDFWRNFRRECPDFPVETRGTNFSTGMDLASDGVPLHAIYRGGFKVAPPPNSPWGVLDGDFGLEMVGFMTRIAHTPGDEFPFRYYTHDPWFQRSPWWDSYDREPYDIYCPLSVGRINGEGEVEHPSSVEFLSVDAADGSYKERCPMEVIPHILIAADHLPDAPGILTWVYPFREYHDMTYGEPSRIDEVYFGDWYVRNAINNGFPLNTIVSSENFVASYGNKPNMYSSTILFAPVPRSGSAVVGPLIDFVSNGGKALLYGPTRYADSRVVELLNLSVADPIEGELTIELEASIDRLESGLYPSLINHRPLTSGGGITEVLHEGSDINTTVCATVSSGGERRIAALIRSLPEWGGGAIGWVRGTNSFSTEERTRLPALDDPAEYFDGSILLRFILGRLGYEFAIEKDSPQTRTPLLFVSRANNGFFFTGYTPVTTVKSHFRFPFGAPLLIGWETRLKEGFSTYSFGRTYHEECRVFVEQEAETTISCTEYPSRSTSIRRRLKLSGLDGATLRFFREADSLEDHPVSIARANGMPTGREEKIPYELEMGGLRVLVRNVSGSIMISW